MTYNEFLKLVDQTFNNFNWRYGQSIMNVLHSVSPSKYSELMNKKLDCYDDDRLVQEVLNQLKNNWKIE